MLDLLHGNKEATAITSMTNNCRKNACFAPISRNIYVYVYQNQYTQNVCFDCFSLMLIRFISRSGPSLLRRVDRRRMLVTSIITLTHGHSHRDHTKHSIWAHLQFPWASQNVCARSRVSCADAVCCIDKRKRRTRVTTIFQANFDWWCPKIRYCARSLAHCVLHMVYVALCPAQVHSRADFNRTLSINYVTLFQLCPVLFTFFRARRNMFMWRSLVLGERREKIC